MLRLSVCCRLWKKSFTSISQKIWTSLFTLVFPYLKKLLSNRCSVQLNMCRCNGWAKKGLAVILPGLFICLLKSSKIWFIFIKNICIYHTYTDILLTPLLPRHSSIFGCSVSVSNAGRLGNQMFELVAAIKVAKERNASLCISRVEHFNCIIIFSKKMKTEHTIDWIDKSVIFNWARVCW